MNRYLQVGLISLTGGFGLGWVGCCAYRRKKGLDKPRIVSKEERTDNGKAELNVKFNTGDEVTITAQSANDDEEETKMHNYAEIVNNYADDPFNVPSLDEKDDEKEEEPEKPAAKKDKPVIISADEFFDEEDGLEKQFLTFYAGDNTLADEFEHPLDNWRELVGVEALTKMEAFGETVQHVRNPRLGVKFEIVLNEGNWGEDDDGH